MIEFFLMEGNLVIPVLFLIQYNCILSGLSSVQKKAYDISRKGSHSHPAPTSQQNHRSTNHKVYIFLIVFIKLFENY